MSSTTTAPATPQAPPAPATPRVETPFRRFGSEFASSRLALAGPAGRAALCPVAVAAPRS